MKRIKQLRIAADALLKTDVGVDAFMCWKKSSLLALVGLLGPLHYYTENFGRFTKEKNRQGLLAGTGILTAVEEQFAQNLFRKNLFKAYMDHLCLNGVVIKSEMSFKMSWQFFLDQTELGTIVECEFNNTHERPFTLQNGMTKIPKVQEENVGYTGQSPMPKCALNWLTGWDIISTGN